MAKVLKFPKGFLWGTATSAFQVEGGIENCDWSKIYSAGKACDHYNRYEQDFDLLKKLNQNAYRFSIEWSRIEPEPGKFDQKEIEHYRKVLESLKSRNIKTMVALHHYTIPLWLAEIGGWTNKKTIFYFSRFAKRVFNEYQDLVNLWVTTNEPLLYAGKAYLEGDWPPQRKNLISFFKVLKNQIAAHKRVYKIFHKSKPEVKVGMAKHFICFRTTQVCQGLFDYLYEKYFLNRIKNFQDFIGVNYYRSITFNFLRKQPTFKKSDLGWEIFPKGIYLELLALRKYQKPIYITENGLADAKDRLRKDFIKDHLYWVHKAIEEGIDVRGYFHWSLMDNFEWDKGFGPRFGLIEIDYQTLERRPRPSALYYAKISKENTL